LEKGDRLVWVARRILPTVLDRRKIALFPTFQSLYAIKYEVDESGNTPAKLWEWK
jgi:hypothetical protein